MKVHLLGTGTSQGIPVIACSCEVCRSTDPRDRRLRTSALIESSAGVNIQIDCGPDFRQQMLRTGIKGLQHLLITHEHMDHIAGIDDIRPFNFRSGKSMRVYASARVLHRLEEQFAYIFDSSPYPGAPRIEPVEITDAPFDIEGVRVQPIPVLHGTWPVLGFRIGSFAYVTDVNHIPDGSMKLLRGLEGLVLGVLHRKVHHAHYHLDSALEVAAQIGAQQTYFVHISHRMGLHEKTQAELPAGIDLGHDQLVLDGLSE